MALAAGCGVSFGAAPLPAAPLTEAKASCAPVRPVRVEESRLRCCVCVCFLMGPSQRGLNGAVREPWLGYENLCAT